nr:unnamed protein product [Callosobruchus analis]
MGKKLNKGTLKIGHINVRSLIPSIVDFEELVISNNLDIIGVSETWLSDDIPSDLLSIPDFNVYRNDRQGRGGGVAVYVRSSIKCKVVDIETPTNALECMIITFKVRHSSFCVGIFYRPPKENLLEAIQFLDNKLASLRSEYDELVLLGDFNVNVLIDNKLNDCLQTYGLKQIITEPTRITETSATLLDPIFVSNIEKVIANGTVNADTFSDHAMAFCDISCNLHSKPKYVTHRDFAMLDIDQFYIDLHGIHWENLIYINDIESKINFLTSNINALFDKHCPIKTVRVTKPKAPWLTPNIRLILKERDKALSKYKAHPSSTNWREYKEKRNFALLAIRNEKAAFLKELQWNNSTKLLYQSLKGMHIQNNNCINIPDNLANPYEINDYFTTMFLKNNEHCVDKIFMYTFSRFSDNNTFSLRPIDSNTLSTIISGITSNASGLDGISLHMLKLCLPVINDYLLHIINSCLEIGYFPDQWKTALVIPKPKCSNPASFNDLRPISLLPVLSKLLERAVHMQLFEYLTRTKILPLHQSGFQKHHSTTTSLAYLSDSILSSLDKKLMNILALLDFSKAFDTLNHSLLIAKCKYYGFDEIAYKFIKSYLVGRAQRVVLNNQASTSSKITSGVPQGSVLGPLLFLLYTSDLKDCIKSCSIQSFADDTQLRCEFKPEDFQLAERQLNDDLDRVSKYCQSHNLKINPTKSKLILFGTKKDRDHLKDAIKIKINGEVLPFTRCAKNLGVYFDENLRFHDHLQYLSKQCYLVLRVLFANKQILNRNLKKDLCEKLVLPKILYAMVVYFPCITAVDIKRLQIIQNTCSRLIHNLRKFDHISHTFSTLRWLNIKNLFRYTFLCFVHKIMLTSTPLYLRQKLVSRFTIHNLSVRRKSIFTMPSHRTALFERSFTSNAVRLYNNIGHEMRSAKSMTSFKHILKKQLLKEQDR